MSDPALGKAVLELSTDDTKLTQGLEDAQSEAAKTVRAIGELTTALSGSRLQQDATAIVASIQNIGGATKLTDAEAKKYLGTLDDWIQKSERMGTAIPPSLLETRDALKQVDAAAEHADGTFTGFISHYLEARAIWEAARESYRALVEFVSSSIEVYAQAEAAERRLTVALGVQGNLTPGLADQYLKLSHAYQETTTNSHTLIAETEALLVQVGNVGPAQMDRALQAVTDLSAGLGIDLHAATLLVGKAFEGNVTAMGRYGVVLDHARVQSEGVTYVLDQLEAKFGGQAQAEVDTYAGKIKQLGNTWDDLKESIGKTVAEDPLLQASLRVTKDLFTSVQGAAGPATETVDDFSAATLSLVALGPQSTAVNALSVLAGLFNAVADGAARMTAITKTSPLPQGAAFSFGKLDAEAKRTVEETIALWEKQDAAAKKHAEAIRQLADHISGIDVAKKVADLNQALALVENRGQPTSAALRIVADEADKLFKAGGTLTPELMALVIQFGLLSPKVEDGIKSTHLLGEQLSKETEPALAKTWQAIEKLAKETTNGLIKLPGQAATTLSGMNEEVKALEAPSLAAARAQKEMTTATGELSQSLHVLGQEIGGEIGQLVKLSSTITGDVKASMKDFTDSSKAFKDGNRLAGITSMAAGITDIASAAIAAGKAIAQMFFGSAGRDAVVAWVTKTYGTFDDLHAKLQAALDPASAQRLWIALTQGVGKNDPAAAKLAIDNITKALAAADAASATFNSSLTPLLTKLQALGGTLPTALIDALKQAGVLTAQNADLLTQLGASGGPTLQQLTALQQKYNLTTAQMGPAFQQANDTAGWQSIIDDLKTATDGGLDLNGVLAGMSPTIAKLVQDSLQFHTTIPANMRDTVQQLAAQGQLLDANGQKITDISQLTFGEDLPSSIDKLTLAVEKLTQAFEGTKSAVAQIPTSVSVDFHATKSGDWSGAGAGAGSASDGTTQYPDAMASIAAKMAAGSALRLPAGLGAAMRAASPSPGAGAASMAALSSLAGQPTEITVISKLDGKEVARNQVRYTPNRLAFLGVGPR